MNLAVEILSTGDELLTGQVVDTNSTWLMDRLWDLGVMVRRKTLVGDDRPDLLAAIRETASRADLVVMSGGLGATEDDLTRECVAAAMGVDLEEDAASLAAIRARYEALGRVMTRNNHALARFPRGATVLPNRFGTAPGFVVRIGRAELVCLPGVREEFQGMCEEAVLPAVAARAGGAISAARLVKLVGIWEAHADEAMRSVMDAPEYRDVRFGYRAHWPEIHVKWSVPPPDAEDRAERILRDVRRLFGDAAFAEGKQEMPELVVRRLLERGERLAIAESFTGGCVAELLMAVPGASAAIAVGVVACDDALKASLLGVTPDLLCTDGGASAPVARAMAEGVRRLSGATWALGITDAAPPGLDPVVEPGGTVRLAVAGPRGTRDWSRRFPGDGERARTVAAFDALNQLRLSLR